ncbi:ribokinase [Acidithiobacillus sp. AMEEHan]|uniref:ribokinase n=1 Tax=Acidithiobacillus sp. AMEEHan TaxID=2994951 RepID=UPI0027E4E3ED|nr:ribokinase [Acidithiobacillus sp. AMEEHan]
MLAVIGSCNVDLVFRIDRVPGPGETRIASNYSRHHGGKGANQAVAARRAGAAVRLIAQLGEDEAGELFYQSLAAEGIDLSGVHRSSLPTGSACILLEDSGENRITVYPGANRDRLQHDLQTQLRDAVFVLAQLEIDPELVLHAARICRARGIPFVLNASPVQDLSSELLSLTDLLVINAQEAAQIVNQALDPGNAMDAARELAHARMGAVITLGEYGLVWASGTEAARLPAYSVEISDSTGCGDAFAGVFVASLAAGASLSASAQRANAAAALTATVIGAQDALPRQPEIEQFLASHTPLTEDRS